MSKYAPLADLLQSKGSDRVRLSFAEIEEHLGFELPASSQYPAWWSNNATNSVMTKVWLDAGWKTQDVDTNNGALTFVRQKVGAAAPANPADPDTLDLGSLTPTAQSVLKVLAKRSGRTVAEEAATVLEETLSA